MSRPTLVLVTTSFPVAGDGSEAAGSFVADLVEELAKYVCVRVVAPGPSAIRETWSDGVEVYRYAAPTRALSTLKPWLPRDLCWIVRVLHGGLQATRAAAAENAGHLLALWGLPCGEWARRVSLESGAGYSVWMLGSDIWSLGRVPFLRGALARVIRRARRAYADGYQLATDAQRIGGAPVRFLPSTRRIGFAVPQLPRDRPPYRLLFLGRWHPNKGVDLLLDALKILEEGDWRRIEQVDIQGGGPLEGLVREGVSSLQSAGRPVVMGRYLAKAEAEAAIASTDWLVIPSRIESIPVVFSDAMKLGRPVVTTPVGDLPRLVGGDKACGVLAEAASAAAIAAALRTALTADPVRYFEGIRRQAEDFALPKVARQLLRGLVDE